MSESNNIDRQLDEELFDFCDSDSLSEEGLREIIERHGLTPNNNHHVDDYEYFHAACRNERVTEGIIRCLLEYFLAAAAATDGGGVSPLHCACGNKHVTKGIVVCLIDAAPESVRSVNDNGKMPLHFLCSGRKMDEIVAIEIMKFLIDKCPEAVRHVTNYGDLPIHIAAGWRSPEYCRVLIDAYPGSERMTDATGALPLHLACVQNTLATVEYLHRLSTDTIFHAVARGHFSTHANRIQGFTFGGYPIHYTIYSSNRRENPATAVEIVEFLLDCDPNVKLQKYERMSLLQYACRQDYNDPLDNGTALQIIGLIYDAHPEAIEENEIMSNIERCHHEVQGFVRNQLGHARQAKVHSMMTTSDMNGRLPLHAALQNNARLGAIKLLVKGNPHALQFPDNNGSLPLHIACQYHDSTKVIQHLVELDASTLDAVDGEGNTVLHLACRRARHDIISLLLDGFDAVSVSTRNKDEKLPIDMLWESNAVEVEDRQSIGYTESVYRLLRANPERIIGIDVLMQSSSLPCPDGKKRKLGQ